MVNPSTCRYMYAEKPTETPTFVIYSYIYATLYFKTMLSMYLEIHILIY